MQLTASPLFLGDQYPLMLRIDDVELALKKIYLMTVMMKTLDENIRADQRFVVPPVAYDLTRIGV